VLLSRALSRYASMAVMQACGLTSTLFEGCLKDLWPLPFVIGRMIDVMMDANYISERLSSMRQELSDLRTL